MISPTEIFMHKFCQRLFGASFALAAIACEPKKAEIPAKPLVLEGNIFECETYSQTDIGLHEIRKLKFKNGQFEEIVVSQSDVTGTADSGDITTEGKYTVDEQRIIMTPKTDAQYTYYHTDGKIFLAEEGFAAYKKDPKVLEKLTGNSENEDSGLPSYMVVCKPK